MKYGLEDEELLKLQHDFAAFPEVDKVVLFGSRAKGNFRNGSDFDFCLEGNKLNLTIVNSISNHIDELGLPYLFDIAIKHQISNPDLIDHINRVGINFYVRFDMVNPIRL